VYIIFLGAPGAGKGTQAANVARELNLAHIATGDLFRQALEKGTKLGIEAKSYMERGELVPNQLTIDMVLEHLKAQKKGVILDGFPRNLEQAQALDKALAGQGKNVDRVIYIKVSEGELLKRLGGRWICRKCQTPYHITDSPPKVRGRCDKCGGELYQRPDDNEKSIKKRLEVYFGETMPLIDYYSRAGKLVEVDGEGEVAEVAKRIVTAVKGASVSRWA
jgi:adenylate kinase